MVLQPLNLNELFWDLLSTAFIPFFSPCKLIQLKSSTNVQTQQDLNDSNRAISSVNLSGSRHKLLQLKLLISVRVEFCLNESVGLMV